jgi:hypothetical protein
LVTKLEPKVETISICGIDGSANLDTVWKLPNLPITEAYGDYDENYPKFDQELMICMSCGHLQLKNQVDPNFLYSIDNYAFRTQNNNKIHKEFEFIQAFLSKLNLDSGQIRAIEIGASNLELAKFLNQRNKFNSFAVCDPLFSNQEKFDGSGIEVIGKLAEDAGEDIERLAINLVIGRHVLEHVLNPQSLLENILKNIDPTTIFLFEVPSLELLRKNLRFDAIFHQHCQYFDEASVKILLQKLGCELLLMELNKEGSNGGSMVFAFKKQDIKSAKISRNDSISSIEKKFSELKIEIEIFTKAFKVLGDFIKYVPGRKAGYGAAHMLATLNYHTGGAIEALDFILDDDELKNNMSYRNIDIGIVHSDEARIDENVIFVPTSYENHRRIIKKLTEKYPNRIISGPIF